MELRYIGFFKRPALVHFSGQEAFAQGAEGHEADAELIERG